MTRPDFSGTWRFNPAASSLQIAAPDDTIFVIDHRDPAFSVLRTHVKAGRRDTFSLDLTTDGQVTVLRRENLQLRAQAEWDGDCLVFATDLVRDGEAGRNVVRYTMTPDRRSIRADERFRSASLNYDNVWALDKVSD